MIAEPKNSSLTKMTAGNIAMVFAPNFLRCPSDDPMVIFESTKYFWLIRYEQQFLKLMISS
jgi:hypothetical protein